MIVRAKTAGFCFGVRRAVDLALNAAKENGSSLYSAGPLIHNAEAVRELQDKGVSAAAPEDIPDGARVLIRAHGIPLETERALQARGCTLIDATCPNVETIHRIAERESANGREVLILGKASHPEVIGIASRCAHPHIAETLEQAAEFAGEYASNPVSVVFQTTFLNENYVEFVKILKKTCIDLHIFDTICKATELRQSEARSFAARSDLVVVIGDPESSNSRSLYDLCSSLCRDTRFVRDAAELQWPYRGSRIFLTAGASVPDRIIEEVQTKMTDEIKTAGTESFEELLEQSLKTLHTGEKVTGVITAIGATEVTVDLGVKQAGYIEMDELSDDPSYKISEQLKVGDEIEAYVVRVNDVEGLVGLSKKRLDAVKNWEKLETAVSSKEILEGTIADQNKGGVVAMVMGIRVFVPASQTGLPREAVFDSLIGTKQKMRITEVNRQRRRVVGSIKDVQSEVRREAQIKVWETIEVGKKYKGIVKSFTSYGAFIDIGGVDGMVHISELSWERVKHPSDVLAIGQEIEVYVIALDPEKHKISLGYRDQNNNPWQKFVSTYHVGDVAPVKVVKFMPFGAFAEVMPGVDGLIHISQIANRRIGRAEEALKLGDTVQAKIINIDNEKQKISLSIRALLEPEIFIETEETSEPTETQAE